jgi:hypothetical protein
VLLFVASEATTVEEVGLPSPTSLPSPTLLPSLAELFACAFVLHREDGEVSLFYSWPTALVRRL